MSDAHQVLSYTISAEDQATAVFRGVAQEIGRVQDAARNPLGTLNRDWAALGTRKPLEFVKAEQTLQLARTEEETRKLTKAIQAQGAATKLQSAELDVLGRKHQALQAQMARTEGSHARVTKAATVMAAGVVAAGVAVVAGSIKQGIAWEQLGRKIEQQTGISGRALDDLMGTINNVSGTVPFKLQEVADAATILKTRFGESGKEIERNSGQLVAYAKRSGQEVTPALVGLSNVMRDFRAPLGHVVGLTDKLVSVSQLTQQPLGTMEATIERFGPKLQAMGFGLEGSIRLMGILGESGVRSDQMGRGLATAFGNAQKQLGGTGGPAAALEQQSQAIQQQKEHLEALNATIPKTTASQISHTAEVKKATAALEASQTKYRSLTAAIKEAGGAHASVGGLVRAEIGQIEHAKSQTEAYSLAAADFGKQVGPAFGRAFFHNKAAIEATDHALHQHGATQKLVKSEQESFEGEVRQLDEAWHKTERTLGKDLIPTLKTFLGLVKGGVEDVSKFTKGNASLAEALGGVATLGAGAFLLRKPLGHALTGLSHVPGLGGLSHIPGVGGSSEIQGVSGASRPGSRGNPIAVSMEGGSSGKPGGTPDSPGSKIPTRDLRDGPTPSERGGVARLLNPSEHPFRAAGILASTLSGFAAMGAPGIKQTPGNDLKAFVHGADPTQLPASLANSIFGTHIPSVSSALGIVPNKLGFDPYERPDLAVRYMLTGALPGQGLTEPKTAAEKHFIDNKAPGNAQATALGASPSAPEHETAAAAATRRAQADKTLTQAHKELVNSAAQVQSQEEQLATMRTQGESGTASYRRALTTLAETEGRHAKAVGELAGAEAAHWTTMRQQAETEVGRADAALRAHPSSGTRAQVISNYNKLAEGIAAQMQAGVISVGQGSREIDESLLAEAKVLGISPGQISKGISGAVKGAGALGGGLVKGLSGLATGGRVPGPVGPDNWTLIDPSGRPAAKVGGAELLIGNRHTEARVDRMLAPYGTSLGAEVAGERTPHSFAKGGVIRGPVSTFGPPGEPAGGTAYGSTSAAPGIAVNPHGGGNWNDALARSFAGLVARVSVAGHSANLKVIDKGPSAIGSHGPRLIDITGAGVSAMGLNPGTFPTDAIGEADFGGGHLIAASGGGGGTVKAIRVPRWGGPGGLIGQIGRAALAKTAQAATRRLQALVPSPAGGGAGPSLAGLPPTGGGFDPAQLGTFDGITVAKWIIPELEYARAHGWKGPVTSGYRAGFDPHAVGGKSMHALDIYPGGAVDFGGMVDPAGAANAAAFRAATVGYTGKRLLSPIGFRDDGHMSGTGHALGGRVAYAGAFAHGGSVTATRPTMALFGEHGPETATFVPHAAVGARIASAPRRGPSGLAETEGVNPETGAIEWHTSEQWSSIRNAAGSKSKQEAVQHRHEAAARRAAAYAKKHSPTHIIETQQKEVEKALRNVPADAQGSADAAGLQKLYGLIARARKLGNKTLVESLQKTVAKTGEGFAQAVVAQGTGKYEPFVQAAKLKETHALLNVAKANLGRPLDQQLDPSLNRGVFIARASAAADTTTMLKAEQQGLARALKAAQKHHQAALAKSLSAELRQVDQSLEQSRIDTATIVREYEQAVHDAFVKGIQETAKALDEQAGSMATGLKITEMQEHLGGGDFADLQKKKGEQEGVLTPAQIAQAQADLAAFTSSSNDQIGKLTGERAGEEAALSNPLLTGSDRTELQKQIAELTLRILELQGGIKDQTEATKELTTATNTATKTYGGTVGFSFGGQNYVAGGQSSNSASDLSVGV